MTNKHNGGPAFPVNDTYHGVGNIERGSEGMTLRDFFAAKAMQGEIAASAGGQQPPPDAVAEYAYKVADAMLKARLSAAQQPAAHPAITHCDKCGCDWLDNGLNPVGCPYCKQQEGKQE